MSSIAVPGVTTARTNRSAAVVVLVLTIGAMPSRSPTTPAIAPQLGCKAGATVQADGVVHLPCKKEITMAIDEEKLNELIGRFVTDFGASMHGATVVIGDKLGLYKELAARGPVTGAELAERTGYDVRLVEEWLNAQFVSG